ncbi:MAG: glutamine--fructose-6-phosphate transaminase (isomerizing), partial [Candidatus Syntropharchaeales archaeon]
MCGIIGYLGYRRADDVITRGLKRMEYRGYDSWGIAVNNGGVLNVHKCTGSIGDTGMLDLGDSTIGIGHTRWATHGKPSDTNAHPHLDCKREIAVVHNGIIENFLLLREELSEEGHIFASETDTE